MNAPAFLTATPLALSRGPALVSARCARRPLAVAPRRRRVPPAPRMSTEATVGAAVKTEPVGQPETLEYRLFYKSAVGAAVSPWHDLPLRPGVTPNVVNFVNEIPRGTQAKMEIATDEPTTPIKQDIKKGALRFYKWGPSSVNYGAVPQTWEDPSTVHPELNVNGDGDPVDVTEIGEKIMPFGAVYPVKVLGCLALLDEGEIDWKVIAINVDDPMADQLNDIADVEKLMPGKVDEVRQWFRMYKTAEGKGENEYAYNGEAKGAAFALKVVEETHESWKKLKNGEIPNEDDLWLS